MNLPKGNPTLDPKVNSKFFNLENRICEAWMELNDGDPSLCARYKYNQAGITLLNYRCVNEIDELVLLTREFHKAMRLVVELPYREPPTADTSISSWISECLYTLKKDKPILVTEAVRYE